LIPLVPDAETREQYVRNIISAYHAATPAQKRRGRSWYRTAHDLAVLMTDGHARKGAGVIAALSANKSWADNVRLAERCLSGDIAGHTRVMLDKVAAIMAGADPTSVLPMDLKTGQFYRCILNPSDPDAVVIDRHAHDIAIGEVWGSRSRGLSSAKRYALIAHAYREASARLGMLPQTLQAITWVRQTESLAGTRGRRKIAGV
jgi:hypothetical protein